VPVHHVGGDELRVGDLILWTEGAHPNVRDYTVKGVWPKGVRGERQVDGIQNPFTPFFTLPPEGRAVVSRSGAVG